MSYSVRLTPTASREYKRLDASVKPRIRGAIESLAEVPRPPGAIKLTGNRSDWRIRVGDYRILYEIDDQRQTVTVWRISHRGKAYR